MNSGDTVRVVRCEACPVIVGREAVVRGVDENDSNRFVLSFGKGRPPAGRPHSFLPEDLEVVTPTSV